QVSIFQNSEIPIQSWKEPFSPTDQHSQFNQRNQPQTQITSASSSTHPLSLSLLCNSSKQSSNSSHSFPLDSLLQHLLHISSPVKSSLTSSHIVPSHNHDSLSAHFRKDDGSSVATQRIGESSVKDEASLDFLPLKCKLLLNSILGQPISSLRSFFDSARFELLQEVDLMSLLKGLDVSGNSDKAILLFEWVVVNLDVSNSDKLDNQIIELMVKILGRESQHSFFLDVIPVKEFALDVRAWTTILHAYSRSGKYEKAIALFDFMKCRGSCPTLVTYNVMLDVYGKKGRSWDKVLELLDEMRSVGLEFDEFTCSTVISACGREGLLEEAKSFFDGLKLNGYVPGTVTYNALLQVYGKAGIYNEALSVLKEMEEKNCPPDSVTYNELVAAYVRAGFLEEGAALIGTMTQKGIMPNAVTYTTVIDAYGKAGKEDKALNLLEQMKKSGCVPNVCTYNSILGMLGKKSRIER
ncbi:UNVERIFIED_CONTAM: Pentatricopeptide repeat-containing protein, chloroplastic, partial [Sesamum latifolium]